MNEDQSAPVRGRHAKHWLIVYLRKQAIPGTSRASRANARPLLQIPIYRLPPEP